MDEEFRGIPRGEDVLEDEEAGEEEVESEASPGDKAFTCRRCGKQILFREYMKHIKEEHPDEFEEYRKKVSEGRRKAWEKSKVVIEEKPQEEMPPEQVVALMGREGLDNLKFKRLIEFLKTAPKVTPSQIKWIETRWKTFSRIREDPSELFRVLKDEAGINDKLAAAIVQSVFSLEEEYADILSSRGEPVFIGRYGDERRDVYYFPRPTPRSPYQAYRPHGPYDPYYGYTAQPYPPYQAYPMYHTYPSQPKEEPITEKKLYELLDKYLSERFEKKEIESKVEKLFYAVEGLKDYVEEQKHEFEKLLLKKSIEEDKAKKSPEEEFLRTALNEANKRIELLSSQLRDLAESMEQKEKSRLEAEIKNLRSEQKNLLERIEDMKKSITLSGFQSDTYKIISQLINAADTRRPIENLLRVLFPEKQIITPYHRSTTLPPDIESELRGAGLIESYGG